MSASSAAAEPPANLPLRFRQSLILWVLGVVGGAAVLPYTFTLQANVLGPYLAKTGQTLFQLGLIGAAQNAFLMTVAVLLGLYVACLVGLRAPIAEALAAGLPVRPLLRHLPLAFALGIATSLAVAALDVLVFLPRLPHLREEGMRLLLRTPPWQELLACLYGAFTEEILLRLLVMSLLCLLLSRVSRRRGPLGSDLAWAAAIGAAVLFGIGHLPAVKVLMGGALTPLLITRVVVLNAAVGICCGGLYFHVGLEAAMVAHLGADLMIHGLIPALYRAGLLPG